MKQFRLSNLLLASLALLVGFTACKPEPKHEKAKIEISPRPEDNTYKFEKEGGTQEFTLKVNRRWTITNAGKEDWFTITPSQGEEKEGGEYTITISVLPNSGSARVGQFVLKASTQVETFTVMQKSSEGKELTYESLSVLTEIAAGTDRDHAKTIDRDLWIKAIVTTHFEAKQFPFAGYHHIQDAGGNAVVMTLTRDTGSPIPFGTEVVGNLKGANVKNYSGTIQIEVNGANLSLTPDKGIEPRVVTIENIQNGECVNQYVRLDGVQFTKYEGVKYYDGSYSTKRHDIEDAFGNKMTLEIYKNCVWKDKNVPQGSGYMIGVATINISQSGQTFYNFRPTLEENIVLNQPRLSGEDRPLSISPAPANNTYVVPKSGGSYQFTVYAPAAWTLEVQGNWAHLSATGGNKKMEGVTLTVDANQGEARTSVMTLSDGTKRIDFAIEQAAGNKVQEALDGGLAALLSKYPGTGTIAEDITIRVVRLSGKDNMNAFSNMYFGDSKAGMMVRFSDAKKNTSDAIPMNTILTINLKGKAITEYQGTLQFNLSVNDIVSTGEEYFLEPVVFSTPEELLAKRAEMNNRLVTIRDVQFSGWKEGDKYNPFSETGTNHAKLEKSAAAGACGISAETSKFAPWVSQSAPGGNGSITGVFVSNSKFNNLWYRTLDDIQFTNPRK